METERLKSIELFETIPDEELAAIAPFAEEREVEAGTPLVNEGQFSYEFMAIEEGTADVLKDGGVCRARQAQASESSRAFA